jgi:hypothetical protein
LCLSPKQKKLYGKSMYDKDLEILHSRALTARRHSARRPTHSPDVPPSCWYRAERERKRRVAEDEAELEQIASEKVHLAKARVNLAGRSAADFFLLPNADDGMNSADQLQAFAERAARLEALRSAPDRATRSSHLKREHARRVKDGLTLDRRREVLNGELRKAREKYQAERLVKAIGKLNPDMTLIRQAQMRKEQLREAGERWTEWLRLTDETNEARGTMLERLFLQHEIMSNLQVQLPNEGP